MTSAAIVREVTVLHRGRRHRAAEQHAFAVAVAFETAEEEQLVREHRTAHRPAEVVLHKRRLVEAGALAEERVRVERLVAVLFEDAAPVGVGARARGDVDDAANEAAELGAAVVGLHAELGDRLRTRRQHDDVAVGRILHRHAVEVGRALVRRAAADLVVASREHVLARQAPFAASLRHDGRRQRNQVEHVAAVQRQLPYAAALHHNADRRVFGLQHRRLAADEIVSLRLPSCRFTSIRGADCTLTAMPSRTKRWNPVSSTSSR